LSVASYKNLVILDSLNLELYSKLYKNRKVNAYHYVNSCIYREDLYEPYAYYSDVSTDNIYMTLGKDEYFIMGDNRLDSTDSRALGPIPETSVISKTIIYSKNTH